MLPPLSPAAVVGRAGAAYPALLALGAACDQADWLDRAARWLAAQDPDTADAMIGDLCATAVAEWRLQHAALWQRVRIRSRFIRATKRCG